jgi:uncharacterized repeat protein (TIGR01451 family)
MRRILAVAVLSLVTAPLLNADVSIIERREARTKVNDAGKHKRPHHPGAAQGSQALIDSQGLKYFINTDLSFSTASSASGAMSEASYTHSVAASTSAGGTTASTLTDAFDGYNAMCLSLNNSVTPCATGNANFVIYNQNGPATTECPGAVSHVNRQVVFPTQTAGSIQMSRKVFVPDNDQFGRWLNLFTNTGGAPQTITMVTSNDLAAGTNTVIVNDSSGNTSPTVADTWVTTFLNFTGNTSGEPRLGHVLQQTGAPVQLAGIFFANGNRNPYWGYTFTLNPGETKIIVNFVTGQPSRAAANAKAAELAGLPPNAQQCLSTAEKAEIANFSAALPDLTIQKSHTGNFTQGDIGKQYTITVSNAGTGPTFGTVTVTDMLPAGLTATGFGGTGWTGCTAPPVVGPGTLSCQRSDVLPAGMAYPPITLTVNVASAAPAMVMNSVQVAGGGETNTANDAAMDPTTIAPPLAAVPTLSLSSLAALGILLGVAALRLLRRRATA